MSYGMDGWNHGNDLVRRKDVMDSLAKEYNDRRAWKTGGLQLAWIEKAVNEVQAAPAQSTVGQVTVEGQSTNSIDRQAAIDACHNYEDGKEAYAYGYVVEERLKRLPSAQPEQRWIPCSERLPEHGGRYLISALDGINRRTTVAPYLPRCKAWAMTGRMAYWKVIAWMSLPEPAKLGGD